MCRGDDKEIKIAMLPQSAPSPRSDICAITDAFR